MIRPGCAHPAAGPYAGTPKAGAPARMLERAGDLELFGALVRK
jgi:hypothetical protein